MPELRRMLPGIKNQGNGTTFAQCLEAREASRSIQAPCLDFDALMVGDLNRRLMNHDMALEQSSARGSIGRLVMLLRFEPEYLVSICVIIFFPVVSFIKIFKIRVIK